MSQVGAVQRGQLTVVFKTFCSIPADSWLVSTSIFIKFPSLDFVLIFFRKNLIFSYACIVYDDSHRSPPYRVDPSTTCRGKFLFIPEAGRHWPITGLSISSHFFMSNPMTGATYLNFGTQSVGYILLPHILSNLAL